MEADGSRWMLVMELFRLTRRSFLFGGFQPREAVLCSAARLTDNRRMAVMSLIARGLMTN